MRVGTSDPVKKGSRQIRRQQAFLAYLLVRIECELQHAGAAPRVVAFGQGLRDATQSVLEAIRLQVFNIGNPGDASRISPAAAQRSEQAGGGRWPQSPNPTPNVQRGCGDSSIGVGMTGGGRLALSRPVG